VRLIKACRRCNLEKILKLKNLIDSLCQTAYICTRLKKPFAETFPNATVSKESYGGRGEIAQLVRAHDS
jgi:hypothetical protein